MKGGQEEAPTLSALSIQTQLLVEDGRTAVLGGLTGVERHRGSGGVPILSSLPLIGGLFGHKSRTSRDTELFMFLTPYVVRSGEELGETTEQVRKNSRMSRGVHKMRPLIPPLEPDEIPPVERTPVAPAAPNGQPGTDG